MHDGQKLVPLHLISYRSELSSKGTEFRDSLAENDGGGDLVLLGALEMMGLLTAASETLDGKDFC